MLVLTRKQNEQIRIGDSITITVLRTKGKAVRLGIVAPHDVNVLRGELAFETAGKVESHSDAEEEDASKAGRRKPGCSTHRESSADWPLGVSNAQTVTLPAGGFQSVKAR